MSYGACTSWPKGLGLGHLLSPLTSTVVISSDSIPQFGDTDGLFLTGFPENRSYKFPLPTLQTWRSCFLLPRPQTWGTWGEAEKFLYSAAQAEENGVSTA